MMVAPAAISGVKAMDAVCKVRVRGEAQMSLGVLWWGKEALKVCTWLIPRGVRDGSCRLKLGCA